MESPRRLKPPLPVPAQSSSTGHVLHNKNGWSDQQVSSIVPTATHEFNTPTKIQAAATRVSALSDMSTLPSERSSVNSATLHGLGRLHYSTTSPITSHGSTLSSVSESYSIEVLVPLRFAGVVNLVSIFAFAVGDLIVHSLEAEMAESSYAVLLGVYAMVISLLVGVIVHGNISQDYFRPLHMLISLLHAALGLACARWRADVAVKSEQAGCSYASIVGLMQFLVVVLYPEDTCSTFVSSLTSAIFFLGLWTRADAPFWVLAEGCIVIFGVACVCMGTCYTRWSAQAHVRENGSKAHAEEYNNEEMQAILKPIFEGESCILTPSSEDPQVATRLDRLTKRLIMTKDNLSHSDVSDDLRSTLNLVFTTILDELKHASTLYLLPMVELVGASPMTVEYVAKTLNQADAALYTLPGENGPTTEADQVRRKSCNEFIAQQRARKKLPEDGDDHTVTCSTIDVDAEHISYSVDHSYVSTSETSLSGQNRCAKEDDTELNNFDEAITAMMSPLTFSEYWDKLPPPCVTPVVRAVLSKNVGAWSFDVFKLSRLCEDRSLSVIGKHAMQTHVDKLGLQIVRVESFLEMIESRYHFINPYHNSMHGADVLNSVFYFLQLQNAQLASLTPLECLSALVAASAHDVGHNSQANRFHVAAQTALSMLYNDQSVLENLHCTLTFAVLRSQPCNFLAGLDATQRVLFRSLIVKQILDTDLSKHIENVSRFRQEFLNKSTGEPNAMPSAPPTNSPSRAVLTVSQRKELLSFILKASDVSGSTKPFDLHVQWTLRINTEFFEQGDAERSLGLPCSPFCDRHGTDVAESQRGFFDFIVMPLYSAFDEFLDRRRFRLEVLPELERNRRFWKSYDPVDFDYSNPMATKNEDMLRRCFARSVSDWSTTAASNAPTLLVDGGQSRRMKAKADIPSPCSAPGSQALGEFNKATQHPLDKAGEDDHIKKCRSRSLSSIPAFSGSSIDTVPGNMPQSASFHPGSTDTT